MFHYETVQLINKSLRLRIIKIIVIITIIIIIIIIIINNKYHKQ